MTWISVLIHLQMYELLKNKFINEKKKRIKKPNVWVIKKKKIHQSPPRR
jgi:hypothetical protein